MTNTTPRQLRALVLPLVLSAALLWAGACGGDGRTPTEEGGTTGTRDADSAKALTAASTRTATPTATATRPPCPGGTPSEQAATVVGQTVTICGVVADASYRADVRGAPTYLNFDRAFPNHSFTAVIWGEDRPKFSPAPEVAFGPGKRVCVTGLVELYQGKPEITVESVAEIETC